MADVDNAFGLRYVRKADGSTGAPASRKFFKTVAANVKIRVGDPVIIAAGSNATVPVKAMAKYGIGDLPLCTLATMGDGNKITGVVQAIERAPGSLSDKYSAATEDAVLDVITDPQAIFEVQADGALAVADAVSYYGVLINADGGSDALNRSGVELNTSTDAPEASNVSNQVKIVSLTKNPRRNDVTGHPVYEVRIHNHTEDGSVGVA